MKGIVTAFAALALLATAAAAHAADSNTKKPDAKPAATKTADSAKPRAQSKYYVMKCKTDACKAKHPTGRYYVPIKKKS